MEIRPPEDIWQGLFEQTPLALRYVFGVLTLGLFTLAGALYKINRENMKSINDRMSRDMNMVNDRMDRIENTMEVRHREMNMRYQETNRLLFEIARNTAASAQNSQPRPPEDDVSPGSY